VKHRHGLVTDCHHLPMSHNRPRRWVLPMYRSSSNIKSRDLTRYSDILINLLVMTFVDSSYFFQLSAIHYLIVCLM